MVLLAAQAYDGLPAKGENVVADGIGRAIMLMEHIIAAVIADVVFHGDPGSALVQIQAPATVVFGAYIVDQVPGDHGAGLPPQYIHAAHIRQHAHAQMMDVVLYDPVVVGQIVSITPYPAAGDAAVVQITDVTMLHRAMVGMHDQHAAGGKIPAAAAVNAAVCHRAVKGFLIRRTAEGLSVDLYAAGTAIVEIHASYVDAAAAFLNAYAVDAEIVQCAAFYGAVLCVLKVDGTVCVANCLGIGSVGLSLRFGGGIS